MVLSRILLVTGSPGIGKTTVVEKAVEELVGRGFKVSGMITREVRKGGTRVGFEIRDLSSGRKGWLAHVDQPFGPRISKYRVNLEDVEKIGARAIQDAVLGADVVVIDEIGPMELFSQPFRSSLMEAVRSEKPILATIHHRAGGPFVGNITNRSDVKVIEVTFDNRDGLPRLIAEKTSDSVSVS